MVQQTSTVVHSGSLKVVMMTFEEVDSADKSGTLPQCNKTAVMFRNVFGTTR